MSDDLHVVPVNDLLEHNTDSVECWCDPTIEVDGAILIVIHNSFDGREDDEEHEMNDTNNVNKCESCGGPVLDYDLHSQGIAALHSLGKRNDKLFYLEEAYEAANAVIDLFVPMGHRPDVTVGDVGDAVRLLERRAAALRRYNDT